MSTSKRSLLCFLDGHDFEVNNTPSGQQAYFCVECGYVGTDWSNKP